MTFRIDAISLKGAEPGGWTCSFKGFRGQGIYGRARLEEGGTKLVLESTMDANERVVIPVGALPTALTRSALHAWIGEKLDALGWGPEVDQANQLVEAKNLGTNAS